MDPSRLRNGRSAAIGRMTVGLEVVGSILFFAAGALLLDPIVGKPARLMALPVVGYWGYRRGTIAGLAGAIVAVPAIFLLASWRDLIPMPAGTAPFMLCVLASFGVAIGRMSDLRRRLEAELAARATVEARLRDEQQTFRVFFEGNPHPMWIFEIATLRFLAVNLAMVNLYGFTAEELLEMALVDIQLPENLPTLKHMIDGLASGREHRPIFDWRHRKKDGTVIEVEIASQPITFQGRPARLGTATDVTDQRKNRAALEYQANHDAMTGLPNRASFHGSLGRAIEGDGRFSLLVLDLDRFKEINDTLGHSHGDLVLRQIGPRLRGSLRDGDILARLGGDEFGILLPGADAAEAGRVGARLISAFAEPFVLEGRGFDLGASIGIAAHPEHGGEDGAAILRLADVAMYAAKRDRAGVVAYGPALEGASRRPVDLMADLGRGIEAGQLALHYQPQVELATGRVCGSEALVRWDHPGEGLLSPSRFVPMAEQAGLIGPMSLWVLREALGRCRSWRMAGLNLDISVNLSPVNFRDDRLVEKVAGLLDDADSPPSWLTIEITEDAMMADREAARSMLCRLREIGVRVSVDDFGTGRSSLAYLRDFPIDEIKIDRSFLRGLATDRTAQAIVRSVLRLGPELGVRVVAEGIEDEETLDRLRGMGCEYAQGFLLSRPLPDAEFTAWIARRPGRRATQLSP